MNLEATTLHSASRNRGSMAYHLHQARRHYANAGCSDGITCDLCFERFATHVAYRRHFSERTREPTFGDCYAGDELLTRADLVQDDSGAWAPRVVHSRTATGFMRWLQRQSGAANA
jgi:hypothetical protein